MQSRVKLAGPDTEAVISFTMIRTTAQVARNLFILTNDLVYSG